MSYSSIEELTDLADSEVIVATTLGELRSALKYDRLGRYVLDQIRDKLDGNNLGYFPTAVIEDNSEPRQHVEVRVFKRNSEVGKVIRAITHPSSKGDRILATFDVVAQSTLDKIRALVCG